MTQDQISSRVYMYSVAELNKIVHFQKHFYWHALHVCVVQLSQSCTYTSPLRSASFVLNTCTCRCVKLLVTSFYICKLPPPPLPHSHCTIEDLGEIQDGEGGVKTLQIHNWGVRCL